MNSHPGDTRPLTDAERERLDELIRLATRDAGLDVELPPESVLLRYLAGEATPADLHQVRSALVASPSLAAGLNQLRDELRALDSPEAREAFDRAPVPRMPERLRLEAARLQREREPHSGWLRWLVPSWATLATATAAVLLVTRLQAPVTPAPAPPSPAPTPTPAPPSLTLGPPGPTPELPPTPTLGLAFLPSVPSKDLSDRRRGPGNHPDTLTFDRPTTIIRLAMSDLRLLAPDSGDAEVSVELDGPGEAPVSRSRGALSDLSPDGDLVLFSSTPFSAGRYTLRVRGLWPDAVEIPPYSFLLRYARKH